MATEASQPLKITVPASAALAAAIVTANAAGQVEGPQYLFVKRDAAGRAIACTAFTDAPIGVLQNKPIHQDDGCEIVVVGITKVVVGAAATFTTFNDAVGFDITGAAVKVTPTGFGGSYVPGTKSCVGRLAPIGGAGAGVPSPGDVTRAIVDCSSLPTPAT